MSFVTRPAPSSGQSGSAAFFIGSSVVYRVILMGGGFVALRWVPPEQLGLWQFALLLEQLLHFVRLGVPNAVNRQVPYLLGQGKPVDASALFHVGVTYVALCGAVLATFVAITLLTFEFPPDQRSALIAMAACAPLNMLNNSLEGLFRGAQAVKKLTLCNVAMAPVALASLALPAHYGFHGFLGRSVLFCALQTALFLKFAPFAIRCRWEPARVRALIKIGFPLYVWNYLNALSLNLLAWYIGLSAGAVMLGLLGPANGLLSVIALVPAAFGSYLGPLQNYDLGRGTAPASLVARVKRLFLYALGCTALAAMAGGMLLALLVEKWLPAYGAIIDAFWVIAAVGCVRCYVVIQTVVGLFVDWWVVRNNLITLWCTRLAMLFAIWLIDAKSFTTIFSVWLAGESLYLAVQWWQLGVMVQRMEKRDFDGVPTHLEQ